MQIDWILIERLVKFGTVGSISFVIDFGLTYYCKERLKLNKFVANAIGFLVSVCFNFMLNKYWTFHSIQSDFGMQFAKFMTIACFSLIFNTFIVYLLHSKIRMNFYLSKMIAVFCGMFFNYSMNSLYTFTPSPSA